MLLNYGYNDTDDNVSLSLWVVKHHKHSILAKVQSIRISARRNANDLSKVTVLKERKDTYGYLLTIYNDYVDLCRFN